MSGTERQTAVGKVLWHFAMSLDGIVAGADHAMDWMGGCTSRPGLIEECVETSGAVLGGRDGWEIGPLVVVDVDGSVPRRHGHPGLLGHRLEAGGRLDALADELFTAATRQRTGADTASPAEH